MENIGLILQERRKELGYSLEEMSAKTKLSTVQLSAIEEGNIQFFKDDLSYLSYFVRYYANALGLEFNDIRDELDETINAYTSSIALSQIEKQDKINTNIARKTGVDHGRPSRFSKKRIDVQTVVLFLVALTIIVLLVYGLVKGLGNWRSEDPIKDPNDVIQVPKEEDKDDQPIEETKPEENEVKPEVAKLSINQESLVDQTVVYTISGWNEKDKVSFEFDFNNASWTSFSVDGVALAAPAARIFDKGEKANVVVDAVDGRSLEIVFGYTAGNTIKINGELFALDPNIAEVPGLTNVTFKLIGGNTNESGQ